MPFIDDEVLVQQVDARFWRLRKSIRYAGNTERFTVPEGFVTDFASVPRVFVWLLPRYGTYTRAAILHDFLSRDSSIDRADADGIFRRSMRELNVPFARRWMMWAAVRAASRLRGASATDRLQFAVAAPLALVYITIPAAVVQVFLIVFWLGELLVWGVRRLFGRPAPRPEMSMRAA